jgi:hypothetical protein
MYAGVELMLDIERELRTRSTAHSWAVRRPRQQGLRHNVRALRAALGAIAHRVRAEHAVVLPPLPVRADAGAELEGKSLTDVADQQTQAASSGGCCADQADVSEGKADSFACCA